MTTPSTPQKPSWMAIWLPRLPTDRLRRVGASPSDGRAFALYAKIGNAFALTAVDAQAKRAGLAPGMALADARAMQPDLLALEADDASDARLLDQIAAWCERFTPIVVVDPPAGLFLDIEGCAHLAGGEEALLRDVETRLKMQGFTARAAIAPSPGAAWACVRFGGAKVVTDDALLANLSPLPVDALRLAPDASALLKRLGLRHIGQIFNAPRQPFTARAGRGAMVRLDQALGRTPEALSPRRPPPPLFALRRLVEPIVTLEAILTAAGAVCADLAAKLDARAVGARSVQLLLFGIDGKTRAITLRLTRPERDAALIMRLLRERLSVSPETLDAEFGFEAVRLDALEIAPIAWRATDLAPAAPGARARDRDGEAQLIDVLSARLGDDCVGRLVTRPVHAPERASVLARADKTHAALAPAPADGVMRRPMRLFAHAQPVDAIASVPDGPPVRFRWRRVLREIARAEGPERIEPDWVRAPYARARDYYRVEDKQGRRYWLYREGAYGEVEPPRWFLHGLFA